MGMAIREAELKVNSFTWQVVVLVVVVVGRIEELADLLLSGGMEQKNVSCLFPCWLDKKERKRKYLSTPA